MILPNVKRSKGNRASTSFGGKFDDQSSKKTAKEGSVMNGRFCKMCTLLDTHGSFRRSCYILTICVTSVGSSLSQEFLTVDEAKSEADSIGSGIDKKLNRLLDLPPDVARALLKNGGHVELNGLSELPVESAQAFQQMNYGSVQLDGIEELTTEAAEALAKSGLGGISLDGLRTLSVDLAKALSRFPNILELDGVESLSAAAATGLAGKPEAPGEVSNRRLQLRGLRTVSVEVAGALANFPGRTLDLSGLKNLSPDTAGALAKFKGCLFLNGIVRLDGGAALLLFARSSPLVMDNLNNLPASALESLAAGKGNLTFEGVQRISLEQAKALSRRRATLSLGVNELSEAQAKVLAQHDGGMLFLNNLDTLSLDSAKALSRHKEQVNLIGLTTLSDEAAAILRENPKNLLPLRFAK